MINPDNCYSSDTPFAKAILGKSLNEPFSYTVENTLIRGIVSDIVKNKKM